MDGSCCRNASTIRLVGGISCVFLLSARLLVGANVPRDFIIILASVDSLWERLRIHHVATLAIGSFTSKLVHKFRLLMQSNP